MHPALPQQTCRADNTTGERPKCCIVTKRGLVAQPAAAQPARRSDGGACGPAPLGSLTSDHGGHLNRAQVPDALRSSSVPAGRPRQGRRSPAQGSFSGPGRTDRDLPPSLLAFRAWVEVATNVLAIGSGGRCGSRRTTGECPHSRASTRRPSRRLRGGERRAAPAVHSATPALQPVMGQSPAQLASVPSLPGWPCCRAHAW